MLERWSQPRCGVCLMLSSEGCSCEKRFSRDFRNMLALLDVEKLIEGSHVFAANFEVWEYNRKFLEDAIDRNGTILDIGCANGFLLRCLQEWTKHELNPYGIDTNAALIDQAHIIFPREQDHFKRASMQSLEKRVPDGFPDRFDMVLFNVWDDILEREWDAHVQAMIETALRRVAPGGRLILTAYHADTRVDDAFGEKLSAHGYEHTVLENKFGHPERAFIIDVPVSDT